jgi:hypothetical protein
MFKEKKLVFVIALMAVMVLGACAGVAVPEVDNGTASNENLPVGSNFNANANSNEEGDSELTGVVESIDGDIWVIDGVTVRVPEGTEINGDPSVGSTVVVHLSLDAEGNLIAIEIESLNGDDANDNANTNENGNDNSNGNENESENENENESEDENENESEDEIENSSTDDNDNSDDDNDNSDDSSGKDDDDSGSNSGSSGSGSGKGEDDD